MLRVTPWDDTAGKIVIDRLDTDDLIECGLVRGASPTALAIWADWRGMEGYRLASHIAWTGVTPFAIFGLSHTGQAGVAAAALLARDHARFRRPLARLALTIRAALPGFAADRGIHRIEARSWADHPGATRLLQALGFAPECDMRGFGLTGGAIFRQWSWLAAPLRPVDSSVCPTDPENRS